MVGTDFSACCKLWPSLFAPKVSPLPCLLSPSPAAHTEMSKVLGKAYRHTARQHPSIILRVLGGEAWKLAHLSHHPAAAWKSSVKRKNSPTSFSLPYFSLICRSWERGGKKKRNVFKMQETKMWPTIELLLERALCSSYHRGLSPPRLQKCPVSLWNSLHRYCKFSTQHWRRASTKNSGVGTKLHCKLTYCWKTTP